MTINSARFAGWFEQFLSLPLLSVKKLARWKPLAVLDWSGRWLRGLLRLGGAFLGLMSGFPFRLLLGLSYDFSTHFVESFHSPGLSAGRD
jgi:hypothetical protein